MVSSAAPEIVDEAVPTIDETLNNAGSNILANKAAGDAFRDELAGLLENDGFSTDKEVYKWTPWGKRYIDIEVSQGGKVLGGIETKLGSSRYTIMQQTKGIYLRYHENYVVQVVRGPLGQ